MTDMMNSNYNFMLDDLCNAMFKLSLDDASNDMFNGDDKRGFEENSKKGQKRGTDAFERPCKRFRSESLRAMEMEPNPLQSNEMHRKNNKKAKKRNQAQGRRDSVIWND